MKKSLSIMMAAATALAVSACKPDNDDTTSNTSMGEGYDSSRLIQTDVPVTRNGVDFDVSVNAYCNKLPNNDTYAQDCAEAAAEAMQQKFMCSRFALAAGSTRSDNQAVIGAGLQGRYDEFPTQYLFTQEKLEARVEANNRAAYKENFVIITDISDLDAASLNFTGGITAPDICAPN